MLAIGLIGALMSSGEFADVERRLDKVEALLTSGAPDLVVVDAAELDRLPGAIEMYRAALALIGGDPAGVAAHAERAIEAAATGDHVTVSAAAALAGLAAWGSGDLVAAHRGYSTAVDGLRRAGHFADVLGCSITLADLSLTQGRLGEARRTYQDALSLAAAEEPDGVMRGTADMLVGLSQVDLERGDLRSAVDHLTRAEELGEHRGLPQHPFRRRVARARLCEAEGDLAAAADLLEEADRVYVGDFSPNVRPVPAMRARLLVAQGRAAEALDRVRGSGLSADDDLSYVREYEHVTLARILLALGGAEHPPSLGTTYTLLERLRAAAEDGGRVGSLIEILTLQALAHHAGHGRHDLPGALAPLEQALRLAEPEGYVHVFVGECAALTPLLEALARRHGSWAYPRRLLTPYDVPEAAPTSPALVEQLSGRERDVLRLLASDLDGPAIARELVVSLNTVRTHTKNIYTKLGVNSRRAAVTRAGELHLLGRKFTT